MQSIKNLTNPGAPLVDGDMMEITRSLGGSEIKQYHTPIVEPAPTHRTDLLGWEFESLFTGAQIREIEQATSLSDDVYKFWRLSNKAPTINVTEQIVQDGLQSLVDDASITLFDANEKARITLGIPL